MIIHKNFVGGNIEVVKAEDDRIILKNELRDTGEDWFYWAFCVEGAAGRTLKFEFNEKNRVGYYGAAVSHDLYHWNWTENGVDESFTYTFAENENRVYFAHHMLYHPLRFFDFLQSRKMKADTLCISEKGNEIPAFKIGNGDKHIILTARHHACESTGNYVLEGVLDSLIKNPIEGYTVFCVPFVDLDGVVNGDQGKSRMPYDHNRDYNTEKAPIYNSTAAIRKYADEHNTVLGFDFHSPWHKGGENDKVFIPQKSIEKAERLNRFGIIFEKNNSGDADATEYRHAFDMRANERWNVIPTPCFASYIMGLDTADIAFTLETAYFGLDNTKFSEEGALRTGMNFANALRQYI